MRQIIDAHVHVWSSSQEPQDWIDPVTMPEIDRDFTLDDLGQTLAEVGVGSAVVVQTLNLLVETESILTRALPETVSGVVGWCDLTAPDVADTLDRLKALPNGARLRGIRHLAHLEPDAHWLQRADVSRGLDAVANAGLVFDLVVTADQLAASIDVVGAHPKLSFVLDHLGKPPLRSGAIDEWSLRIEEMAAMPNVAAKVSGLTLESDWAHWRPTDLEGAIELALDSFGPDRLMFGSDWPLVRLTGGYRPWLDAATDLFSNLSDPHQSALFFHTANRIYALGVTEHA